MAEYPLRPEVWLLISLKVAILEEMSVRWFTMASKQSSPECPGNLTTARAASKSMAI